MEDQKSFDKQGNDGRNRWESRNDEVRNSRVNHSRRKKSFFGLAVILFGVWWLLRRMDIEIVPDWVMTWPMILIIIGLFQLISHGFRSVGGYIMVFIGSVFLAKNAFNIPITIEPYFWPVVVIFIGIIIFFKPGHRSGGRHGCKKKSWDNSSNIAGNGGTEEEPNDRIDTLVVMGGTSKEIISKNFKGGELTAVMGGAELYFGNADIVSSAQLDITLIMGGIKLVVPSNWDVVVNTTNLLGGVEDKRKTLPNTTAEMKILTITGTVIMGGIEIKTY